MHSIRTSGPQKKAQWVLRTERDVSTMRVVYSLSGSPFASRISKSSSFRKVSHVPTENESPMKNKLMWNRKIVFQTA